MSAGTVRVTSVAISACATGGAMMLTQNVNRCCAYGWLSLLLESLDEETFGRGMCCDDDSCSFHCPCHGGYYERGS